MDHLPRRSAAPALCACIAIFLQGCSSVPDLHVSGSVTDGESGAPVAGARVYEGRYAPDLAAGATTSPDGSFEYFTYPEEHWVIVEAEGYESFQATIGLDPRSKEERLTIVLAPKVDG